MAHSIGDTLLTFFLSVATCWSHTLSCALAMHDTGGRERWMRAHLPLHHATPFPLPCSLPRSFSHKRLPDTRAIDALVNSTSCAWGPRRPDYYFFLRSRNKHQQRYYQYCCRGAQPIQLHFQAIFMPENVCTVAGAFDLPL